MQMRQQASHAMKQTACLHLSLKSVDRQQDGMEPTEGKLREQFGVSYKNTHAALMDSAVIS